MYASSSASVGSDAVFMGGGVRKRRSATYKLAIEIEINDTFRTVSERASTSGDGERPPKQLPHREPSQPVANRQWLVLMFKFSVLRYVMCGLAEAATCGCALSRETWAVKALTFICVLYLYTM